MRLKIANIGKIKSADVEMNGITVIAGENDTGKSTIGKMLFCIFDSFCGIEKKVITERKNTVRRTLAFFEQENMFLRRREVHFYTESRKQRELIDDLIENKDDFVEKNGRLEEKLTTFYQDKLFDDKGEHIALSFCDQLAERLRVVMSVEDEEIRSEILKKRLDAEFAMRIVNLNNMNEKASVRLEIKENEIEFEIEGNKRIIIKNYIDLTKEAIYIDDPFIIDDVVKTVRYRNVNLFGHREHLKRKLIGTKEETDFTLLEEVVAKKKLDNVLHLIEDICDGEIEINDAGRLVYKTEKVQGSLEMVNLSTGMKSFVILERLLENGSINENGTLILDEPEIHLHPQWQLKFAEFIVLLRKEFGLHILLNTHSPYFLNAIEVYSEKYGIDQECKYYLSKIVEGSAVVSDVTENKEEIYNLLARPLQDLENMEYENERIL